MGIKGNNSGRGRTAVCVALSAVLLTALSFALSLLGGESRKGVALCDSPSSGGAAVFFGSEKYDKTLSGSSLSGFCGCADSSVAAVIMADSSPYTLYCASDGKVNEITSSVTNNCVISYSGNAVVYIDSVSAMYKYSVAGSKSEKIDESVKSFAVSPDGSRILYLKNEDAADSLYLYENGKITYITNNYTPLAVSDDSSYIYALGSNGELCLLNKDGTLYSKLSSGGVSSTVCFSSDISSVVFSDSDYSYISHNGKSKARIVQGTAQPTNDKNAVPCCSDGGSWIYGDDDLSGMFYIIDDEGGGILFYQTDSDEKIDIALGVRTYTVAGKDKAVYLTTDGGVYCFDGENSERIAGGAETAACTRGGKYIYFTDRSAQSLYVYHRGKTAALASLVKSMTVFDDRLYFIQSDGEFYSVSGDSRPKLIDTEVYDAQCSADAVFYGKNYDSSTQECDIFVSDGKSDFSEASKAILYIR